MWKPQTIVMSGVTDRYQPVERKLELTRGCLRGARRVSQPGRHHHQERAVARDPDLLGEFASHGAASMAVSSRRSTKISPG